MLAERGILVFYEAIRYWCQKFGPSYSRTLRRKQGRLGDIWHVDELFVTIQGQRLYLWRAVDQDGDVIELMVTKRRDRRGAKRFFRRALKHQGQVPWQLITRFEKGTEKGTEVFPPKQVVEARVVVEVVGFTVRYGSLLYNYKPDLI